MHTNSISSLAYNKPNASARTYLLMLQPTIYEYEFQYNHKISLFLISVTHEFEWDIMFDIERETFAL